ncbi:MAG TPA: DUF4397 domain-containing protein [Gemmatimonadales bacterium]|nr:DUF4397 domain-containing protein [Gemmatimonadales bacterium]
MKRTLVLFFLAAAALSAACSDDGNTAPEGQGRLRIVHVSPDAPNLDVVLDGDTVASDIAYLGSSDYLELSAGGHVMQISETNTSTTLIDQDVTVADGVDYTVIVGNTLNDIDALVLTDDNGTPPAGTFRVRAVHGAKAAGPVDIYVTDPGTDLTLTGPTASNVAFEQALPYVQTNAGTYQVRVTPTGTKDVIIDSGALTLENGQVRTAIAVEAAGGGEPFNFLVLNDLN